VTSLSSGYRRLLEELECALQRAYHATHRFYVEFQVYSKKTKKNVELKVGDRCSNNPAYGATSRAGYYIPLFVEFPVNAACTRRVFLFEKKRL
jgi:hypothetical protein